MAGWVSRELSQALLGGANQQDRRQRADTDAQEVPPEREEELVYCAVSEHWNRLATEVVESPSLEIPENQLTHCGPSQHDPFSKSPPDSTPRRPVLSVSARKIKDNAADWHNLMMKWERLNDNGFTTANKIVNMRISEQFQENKLEIACDNNATEPEKPAPKYNEELDNCCAELLETLKHMTKIQLKMEKLTSTTKAICDLETFHHGAGNCRAPFFHTWPTPYFYEVCVKLSEMYKKELQLKQTIVQDIAHSADQDLMMVYLSSWLYQPYIENSSMLLLEAMLLETGHRQC